LISVHLSSPPWIDLIADYEHTFQGQR